MNSMVINFHFPSWYTQGVANKNQPKTIIQNLGLKAESNNQPQNNVLTSEFQTNLGVKQANDMTKDQEQ